MPTSFLQLALLGITGLLFAAAFFLGLQHMRRLAGASTRNAGGFPHEASMGPPARLAVALGIILGLTLLTWRALSEHTLALPLSHPFDAFLVLAMLLALTVIYFRWTRHLRSFSFFLLPMIVILLILGLLLTALHPNGQHQDYTNIWYLLHVTTIVAGTVCFALGCVGGGVYLLADRQLRRKGLDSTHRWIGLPPLASLEKINRWMIYAGFPLLMIATIAGFLRLAQAHAPEPASTHGITQLLKISFGILSLLTYALLLPIPLNPRLRGRPAAWLSIVGFILFIGAFAAANWS